MRIKDIFSSIFRSNKSSDDTSKSLTEALKYIEQNKYKDAESILRKYLKNNQHDFKALKTLGLCLIELKNYDESIENLSNVLKIQPNDSDSYSYIFEAFIRSEQYKKAEKFFKYSIKNNPNINELYFYLARIYEFIPDIKLFNKNFNKAIRLNNKDAINWKENNLPKSYNNIIISLFNNGKYKEFIEISNKYINISNNSDFINHAIAYKELGQITKAENILKEIILKTKDFPISKAFYELGLIYKQTNREKERDILSKEDKSQNDYSYIYDILEKNTLIKDRNNEYIIYSTKNNIDLNKLISELNLNITDNKFKFNYLDKISQDFSDEIINLQNYIYSLVKENIYLKEKLLILEEKLSLINKIFIIKRDDNTQNILDIVKNITKKVNGFILYQNNVYNNEFNLYLDKEGLKENITLYNYESAISRKNKNNLIIQSRGFSISEESPVVVCEEEVNFRKPQDIAKRAIVLFYVIKKAQGIISKKELKDFLLKENLLSYLKPKEEIFLKHSVHSKSEIEKTLSKIESVKTMLWILNHIFYIGFVDRSITLQEINSVINEVGLNNIFNNSELRPIKEILDHYDLLYRLYYYLNEIKHDRNNISETKIDERIILERLSALKWSMNINN